MTETKRITVKVLSDGSIHSFCVYIADGCTMEPGFVFSGTIRERFGKEYIEHVGPFEVVSIEPDRWAEARKHFLGDFLASR